MDNERSIASAIDGLKPGSRKVLFTCIKRNDKREIKVAQLAGSVAEHSAYHHGEVSLMSTIVNLAQNYVGSNNINLLQPIGQFGTRLQGGKDAASPRYIFTMLSPLTRLIFHPHDDPLLTYLRDDNKKIEPIWYMPIIPMVLVNGAEGIGTGWMTKIPNHNPREIIDNIKRMLRGEDQLPMKPYYKNFIGEIERLSDRKYISSGEVGLVGHNKVEITELPVGVWTQNYKENVLEPMITDTEKSPAVITDYKEYNTDTTIKFVITMNPEKRQKAENEGIHKFFKLHSSIGLTSMCAFDKDSVLKKYESTTQLMSEFYTIRLEFYGKRKNYLEGMLGAEAAKLTDQARFIVEKCDGDLRIENRKKTEMVKELVRRNFRSDPVKTWKLIQDKETVLLDEAQRATEETEEEEEEETPASATSSKEDDLDYDYLLGMSFWNLTLEKKNELLRKKDEKITELEILKKKSPSDLWNEDLNILLEKLDEVEEKERLDELGDDHKKPKGGVKGKLAIGGKKKPQLAADSLPSPAAKRVVPKIDAEMIKKEEKLIAAKENKGKRAVKTKKGEEDGDSCDDEAKKVKKEKKTVASKKKTDGLKQTKLDFGKTVDDENDGNLSSSPSPRLASPISRNALKRRQAAERMAFKFDSDSNDEDDPGVESDRNGDRNISINDDSDTKSLSDVDFIPKQKTVSAKKVPAPKKEPATKKPPPATKKGPPKKNITKSDVINLVDEKPVEKKCPPAKRVTAQKKTAIIEISDSENISDGDLSNDDYIPLSKPQRKPRAAASKPKRKYSSSDSDDLFISSSTSTKPQKSVDNLLGKTSGKKKVFSDDDEDDGQMSDNSDFVPEIGNKKKVAVKTSTRKPPAKKAKAKSPFASDDSD